MKHNRVKILFLLPALLCGSAWTFSIENPDAKEIIKRAEDKLRGTSSEASMSMTIVRPKWERTLDFKTWSKGTELAMILITGPARDKGTAFLKKGKEVWNWQPSIERTIKLPPSMMMQSWMGSDFTNDDLVKESSTVTDYTHKLLKDTTIQNRPCWTLELIPKEDAAVVWGKVIVMIDKKDYIQMRGEFYDEDLYLVNIMQAGDIGMLDGKMLAKKVEMIPVDKKGHKTVIEYHSLVFNKEYPDEFFSVRQLKDLR